MDKIIKALVYYIMIFSVGLFAILGLVKLGTTAMIVTVIILFCLLVYIKSKEYE